ncbi:hypothetical protein ES703_95670 [subsurface metagenome]
MAFDGPGRCTAMTQRPLCGTHRLDDLGNDVKLERFLEEQQVINADLVGISALMTTSMLAIPKIIKMIKEKDSDVIILAGGAPLTQEIAKLYGADGYADSAGTAVDVATKLIKKRIG